jgi:periplasmic divalent cation tolerance protein
MKVGAFRPGIILVTAPNTATAENIARSLIEQRLAACVSMLPITSVYRWQGNVNLDSEVQLLIKANIENFTTISEHIRSMHPYEVPEIVSLSIEDSLGSYLKWMRESCE